MKAFLKKNKTTAAAIFAAACVISATFTAFGHWDKLYGRLGLKPTAGNGSFVRFVDVGQGDCTLVQSDGKIMLIDTGDAKHSAKLCKYIRSLGFTEIDSVIITHPHADHIGGLANLCDNFSVGRVYITSTSPNVDTDRLAYDDFLSNYRGEISPVEGITDFTFGSFTVSLALCDSLAEDENDRSAVILLRKDDFRFLITGDISSSDALINTSANVLKVAHHGSKTGTSAAMLSRVRPEYAVISVGSDNAFGHPDDEVLLRLEAAKIKLYRTDCNGTVTFDVTDKLKIDTEY